MSYDDAIDGVPEDLCEDCDGTGDCPWCGGSGVETEEGDEPCDECDGSGECQECQ